MFLPIPPHRGTENNRMHATQSRFDSFDDVIESDGQNPHPVLLPCRNGEGNFLSPLAGRGSR